jgi:hypothetical protein
LFGLETPSQEVMNLDNRMLAGVLKRRGINIQTFHSALLEARLESSYIEANDAKTAYVFEIIILGL